MKDRHQGEGRPGVRSHGLDPREARRSSVQTQEEIGLGCRAPRKTAFRRQLGQAVTPDQLGGIGGTSEVAQCGIVCPQSIGAIEAGPAEERFRRQAGHAQPSSGSLPSYTRSEGLPHPADPGAATIPRPPAPPEELSANRARND